MICRLRPGFLDIRSVSGDLAHEVDLQGETTILSAALDEAGERLAVVFRRNYVAPVTHMEEEALAVVHLRSGVRRFLCTGLALGPIWFPGEDRLAFANGTAICLADATTGSVEEVYRFSEDAQGFAHVCLRPDGGGLAFLKWVGDNQRIGVVDLDTGEGWVHAVSCSSYCWWDAETILYVLGSGLKLLDVHSGRSRTFLKDLTALDRSGGLAALGEGWVEAVGREDGFQDLREVLCVGDRVYFGARVGFPVTRRTVLPFIRRTGYRGVEGLLSMTRDRADLRQHLDAVPAPLGIVSINAGRTLAIQLERRGEKGWLESVWVFAGEAAESIAVGFGPLPRASFEARGNVHVGDFARLG